MNDYCAILPLAPPLDDNAVMKLARHSCLDIHRVEWLRAYLAQDGERMLCWYRARDAESVRLVLRQQDAGDAKVWAVRACARESEDPTGNHRVIVVVALDDPSTLDALRGTVIRDLADRGCAVSQEFAATDGTLLALACEGQDRDGLASANLQQADIWAAVELQPQLPELFPAASLATADRTQDSARPRPARADFDAVVIGAGIGGICALQRLRASGLSVQVYDSADGVGGVWHWNRYPGARVDSETYSYGLSLFDGLAEEWAWPELFCAQPEIERYLQHAVKRFDLGKSIRLGTRITSASFDASSSLWTVHTASGEAVTSRYLVAAAGALSARQLPDYPGMEDFGGEIYHTGRWPGEGVELADRRVAVIGTGASGVQVIQSIAAEVAQLTVFQRTPNYCVPQRNRPLSEGEREQLRREWSAVLDTCHQSEYGFIHLPDPRSGLGVSAAEREAKFEELWVQPGFSFWMSNFADLMMNREVNAHASEFVRRKIAARVQDPVRARKLMPDHPFGAKRVPLENGYYEVFNRSNVDLVDLRETPIQRVTPSGIRTTEEEYPHDVIICATGFDAGTGALTRIDLRGKHGQALGEEWLGGATTYLGLLVSGFPNLFLVNGPQNAAALCNATRCIEQNVDWIARCIAHAREQGLACIEATPEAGRQWREHVDDVAEGSVLGHMKDSWFFGSNTPNKPHQALIYAAGARRYREICNRVARDNYPGILMY